MAFDHLLHFEPQYHSRVWGGRRLDTVLGRDLPTDKPVGESWELVDRTEHQSVVAVGAHAGTTLHELWSRHRAEVFGVPYLSMTDERFPLLIKILDCTDDLSIQVHPPAGVAPQLGGEPKTEMWFVADAGPDARLFAGVRAGVSRASFEQALQQGTVADQVHALPARAGDSLFVPSGRVHALGAGLLVYEIQQSSDTTYRVFDWNRIGLDGKLRQLHIEESLQCIDFDDVEPTMAAGGQPRLADCPFFRVSRAVTGHRAADDRFRLIMPVRETEWGGKRLEPGRLTLKPATARIPPPDGEWLEIELPV